MKATPTERGEWEPGRRCLVQDKLMVMSERGGNTMHQQAVGGARVSTAMLEVFGDATKDHNAVPSTIEPKVNLLHVGEHTLSLERVAADDQGSIFTLSNPTETSCKRLQASGSVAIDDGGRSLALVLTDKNTAFVAANTNKRACPFEDEEVMEIPPSTTKRRAVRHGDTAIHHEEASRECGRSALAVQAYPRRQHAGAIVISLKDSQTPPPAPPRAERVVYEIDADDCGQGCGPGGDRGEEDKQMARAMVLSVMEQSASRHGAASSSMAPVIPSPKRSDPCTSGVRRNVPCSSRAQVVVLDDDNDQAGGQDECYRQAMANSLKDSMRRPSSSERTSNKDCSQAASYVHSEPEPDWMEIDSVPNTSAKASESEILAPTASVPSDNAEVTPVQKRAPREAHKVQDAFSPPIELEQSPPIPNTELIEDDNCTQPLKLVEQADAPVVNILINLKGGIPTPKQLCLFQQVQDALYQTHAAQGAQQSEAKLCRLEMGDFMCELGERDIGERDSDCTVLGYAVQRRTISDLVWRGGKGEHLEQLGRLVSSPFKRSFLLLEGDPQEASSFSAFGVERRALMQNTPGQVTGVQSAHDVCKLEAWVVAINSDVRVLHTKDEMGTCHTLAFLALLAAEEFSTGRVRDTHSLAKINAQFSQEEISKCKLMLEKELVAAGAPAGAVALLAARFESVENMRAAYSMCTSDVHRAHLAASLLPVGERSLCDWSRRVWQVVCADDSNPKSLSAYTHLVLEGVPCMEPQLNVTAGSGAFEWVSSWMPAGGTAGVVVALDESLPSGGARLRVMHGRLQSATCVTVVLQGQEFLEQLLGVCVNLLRTKDAQAQELAMLAGDELHMNLRRLACTERQAANTQYVLVVQGLDSAMDVLRKGKQPPSTNQAVIESGAFLLKLGLVEFVDMCICLLVVKFRWHIHKSSTEETKAHDFFEALFQVYREHALPYGS
eukprot:CAMPEP_0114277192 /NCGR_PEP_ID=MMETSP0059-20121206/657_1 /TAXON_ID=36894 /ORGANISM="Pyramimonas parkeae, Strain CCMP726" /LENGTH=950 /DNA_ID=CAMNT_0001397277 /DNA_START=16 /DNA_END=2870 /DNA_ORIENTATION=+